MMNGGESRDANARRKKSRKQRIIKNGIVNIDNVSIEAGVGMVNWLKIAKYKLKQRELGLMQQRQRRCVNVIIEAINQFTVQTTNALDDAECKTSPDMQTEHLYRLYDQEVGNKMQAVISRFTQSIAIILAKWKGCRPKREVVSFRKYFQAARRWFDTKKIAVMALEFYIPLMQCIHEFAKEAAARFPCDHDVEVERLYRDYLNALILSRLCEGVIKPANTRALWLIPSMAYPIFLSKYNQYLQIPIQRPVAHRKNKVIRYQYLECLRAKENELDEAFQAALLRLHHTRTYETVAPVVPVPTFNPFGYHDYNAFNYNDSYSDLRFVDPNVSPVPQFRQLSFSDSDTVSYCHSFFQTDRND